MSYDFSSLSHPDFESLCLDLVGAHTSLRFEAFSPGPDGGIDGRHAKANELTILQVKHYRGSRFSDLTRAMRHERASIEELQQTRYILATSHVLTPDNKAVLAETIGPSLQSESDILGPAELNRLLRDNRDIEKAHIKLWLSSAVVLDQIVNAALSGLPNAQLASWAQNIWNYLDEVVKPAREDREQLLYGFRNASKRLHLTPVFKKDEYATDNSFRYYDLAFTSRLQLLLKWWSKF